MATMKTSYSMAYVAAPGVIEFREKELPELGDHEVLIGVRAAAICGSDLHIFKGKHPSAPLPVSVGHEIAGDILEIGRTVSKLQVGDRVTVEPVVACGHCDFCRKGQYHLCQNISFQYRLGQGGFAPYFIVSEEHAFRLPAQLTYEEGALVEPLAVALHAVKKSRLGIGDNCAIFGAGAIGLLVLMLSRRVSAGEAYIVDVQNYRLEKAQDLGATLAIHGYHADAVKIILERTLGLGVDRSFEAVGVETTLVQALQVLKKGGNATLLGIFENPKVSIPINLFVQREILLSGSQGYNWDFQDGLLLLEKGGLDLKPLISHRIPLKDLQQGFKMLCTPENHAMKVMVSM